MTRLGAVLAGGQSRRFGSDKALAIWDGQPLIVHAAAILARHTDEVVICGRGESPTGLRHLPDRPAPGLGPLGGLCAALHHATESGHDAVLSLGCDMPRIDDALLDRLCRPGPGCYLIEAPIVGCWPAALAEALTHHLAAGGSGAVGRWAAQAGLEGIEAGAPPLNLKSPADLAALRRED
jgi:molybdopterin-guanine dinucleotide biosynthesis protein A